MIASIIFCGCGKVWWTFLAFLALKHLPSLNICHLRSEALGHLESDFAVMMCRRFSKNSPILFWLCKKNCFFGQFLILLNEYYFSYNQVLISGQLQQQILGTTVNRISGVMVSKLALSVLDCGFKPQSCRAKDYKIGICCFSAKHTALRRKIKDWLSYLQTLVKIKKKIWN